MTPATRNHYRQAAERNIRYGDQYTIVETRDLLDLLDELDFRDTVTSAIDKEAAAIRRELMEMIEGHFAAESAATPLVCCECNTVSVTRSEQQARMEGWNGFSKPQVTGGVVERLGQCPTCSAEAAAVNQLGGLP